MSRHNFRCPSCGQALTGAAEPSIVVSVKYREVRKIQVFDIRAFESANHMVFIHLGGGESYPVANTEISLAYVMRHWANYFDRVSRSSLVRKGNIARLALSNGSWFVETQCGLLFRVSKRHLAALKKSYAEGATTASSSGKTFDDGSHRTKF